MPPGDYVLQADGDDKSLPAQVFQDDGKRYLGVVLDHVTGSAPEQYTLRREPKSELTPPGVELRRKGPNVEVVVGGKPLTEYVTDDGPKPYYFPVIGPTGAAVTRAFPMKTVEGEDKDHPHQRSLWFTHGKVNGVDFWSEMKGHGSIKETAKKTVAGGSAVGLIRTTDDWIGPDGRKVCEDERVVRFYDTAKARVFDFDITLKATDGPVTFGDTKEGMFGVRVASSMDVDKKKGGKITNAEGLTDDKAWGSPRPGSITPGRSKARRSGSPSSTTPRASATPPPGTSGPTASSPPTPSDGTTSARSARATTPSRPANRSASATASSSIPATRPRPICPRPIRPTPTPRPSRCGRNDSRVARGER